MPAVPPLEEGDGRAGAPAIDPERLREAQRRQRQNELARLMLVWFLTTDAPVAWVGTAQSPDGTADVIEIKPAEGAATRVFLDSTTHMPLMMTNTGFGGGRGRRGGGADGRAGGADGRASGADGRAGAPPQPITIETHLSEYKAVNGIKLPHLITRGVNGQTNEEWEIKNYRINPNLKQNTFTQMKRILLILAVPAVRGRAAGGADAATQAQLRLVVLDERVPASPTPDRRDGPGG